MSIRMTKADSTNIAGEHAGDVEHAFGLLDQIAEPPADPRYSPTTAPTTAKPTEVCSEENIHDSADGQYTCRINCRSLMPEHAAIVEHGGRDFLDALIDVEEHDEEHQRDAERDLGPDAQGPATA